MVNLQTKGKPMSALVKTETHAVSSRFTNDQIETIKDVFCKGLSNDEFKIFLYSCERTGLDPFAKQIYAVKRNDKKLGREVMTIQTGIDGYRAIADRTERYAPGKKPSFAYDPQGKVLSATAYVMKLTKDGKWHEVEAEAFYDEYVQTTYDGRAMGLWNKMVRTMLAKCAEALALRKAFPSQLSGIYTQEEMQQADAIDVTPAPQPQATPNVKPLYITKQQADELQQLIGECNPEKQEKIWGFMEKKCGGDLMKFPAECYENTKRIVLERRAEYIARNIQPTSMDELVDDEDE
jgi:phage recombination protein Bet